ncbi:MFS transporter [Propioniciclava sinopodophylli]|uniref:MFS transporter n=1 Tax=Propioniciclava sinopodophylli TaxID=1837344 RepID=A0A4Q9KEI8_9ACTN|nr:MFS transporter [Propioniciclava sinopodophylli]TBT85854.1 MFS transporter [Propioniciclava sinopodophylli]
MAPTLRTARTGISLFFFTNGALFAGMLPRYPEIKAAFEISNTQFGFMVAIGPVASMLASTLPAPLIRRFGAQHVALGGTIVMAAAIALAGVAPATGLFALFAAALAVAGFSDAIVDAAQNVHGVKVEDAYGKTIINSLHAFWSLGSTTGGAIGAAAAALAVPLGVHLGVMSVVMVGVAALATWLGRIPGHRDHEEGDADVATAVDPAPTKLPKGAWGLVLPMVALAVAGALAEDVAANWSALYLVQVVGVTVGVGGLGYAVMLGAQFVGRLLGDPATDRWGPVRVIQVGGAMIALGGALVVFVPTVWTVMLGYALAGYGCATIVPAAYAAAGRLPGLPEGAGITLVSWLMRIAFLATSPLIGSVADLTNLRVSLGVLMLGGLTVIALAGVVRPVDDDS